MALVWRDNNTTSIRERTQRLLIVKSFFIRFSMSSINSSFWTEIKVTYLYFRWKYIYSNGCSYVKDVVLSFLPAALERRLGSPYKRTARILDETIPIQEIIDWRTSGFHRTKVAMISMGCVRVGVVGILVAICCFQVSSNLLILFHHTIHIW